MNFSKKPVIACVHLLPTLGSHQYDGNIDRIYETAISDVKIYLKYHVDALIVENFRDGPFYPETVPSETVATLAGVTREIVKMTDIPVGVAVLRNDAEAALSIATAVNADFIRINVHLGAVLSPQGILQGNAHKTLRTRSRLMSKVAIYADAGVKHSSSFVYKNVMDEVKDLSDVSDAIILSGEKTGIETNPERLTEAKNVTKKPILVGSGVTPENIHKVFSLADGFIVGSYFKQNGNGKALVDELRVKTFMEKVNSLRSGSV